ncbi:hypothetical protein Tco_0414275 [Tanacetum coccineum]
MSPENKAHYKSEKDAIHLLLTGTGDEIYSTFDACKIAHEMWIAIDRLQQGESLNIQDVKTNLFWEFGKFTSHDGESIEFVTIVMQQHDLDTVSYHKLFDILKEYQKEINEICAERIAKNANPLALVATDSPYPDTYYQAPKSHKPYAPTSKQSSSTRSNASTKYKGKEIAKSITPPSESASEEDSDPEQAQRDKDMQKNLALIAKYFKKIYKPTNNNLGTSLNSRNKNMDTSPRYENDNQTRQFGNQRTVTVAGARETVDRQECRKPKRVKDYLYHKEKVMLCKQAKKGVPLQAEQADWLPDMNEEIDEQELESHYNYMAKIQEVPIADSGTDTEPLEKVQYNAEYNVFSNERHHSKQPGSISNTCIVEKVDSNVIPDSPNMCDNDIHTDQITEDERVALANLIANLKLDVDENKKIQKQLKKANTSLSHELKECKSILAKTSRTLRESNSIRDSCLIALQNKQTELETYKTLNDSIVDYDKLELVKEKHDELVKQSLLTKSYYEGLVEEKTKIPFDTSDPANRFIHDREETLTLEKERSNTLSWKPCQGGSSKLNLPDHRYKRRCCSLIPAESDSLPHAYDQTTKTYYKHQDSRIKKAQVLKTKTSTNSDIKDNSTETNLRGRLLESFQEDSNYEHVGKDTRSQGGKDDQYKQEKDLEISK